MDTDIFHNFPGFDWMDKASLGTLMSYYKKIDTYIQFEEQNCRTLLSTNYV